LNAFSRTHDRRRPTTRADAHLCAPALLLPQDRRTLRDVITTLDSCIEKLTAAQLHETATLLSIARLDLVAHLNGITDQELQDVATAAQDAQAGDSE